jgi:hypothetical protein
VEGLQLELDLIGKTTYEQQQLTAARQIDLQTKQRIYEALATLPEDASAEQIDRVVRSYQLAAERQKGVVYDLLRTRREAERSWATGSRDAFTTYVDNATNAAEAARTVFTDAFRGMEDALVQFVKTGKVNFKDLRGGRVLLDAADRGGPRPRVRVQQRHRESVDADLRQGRQRDRQHLPRRRQRARHGRRPRAEEPEMGLMRDADGTFYIGAEQLGGDDFGQSFLMPLIAS